MKLTISHDSTRFARLYQHAKCRDDDYLMSYISTACKYVGETKFSRSTVSEVWYDVCCESYIAFFCNLMAMIMKATAATASVSMDMINRCIVGVEAGVLLSENVTKICNSSVGVNVFAKSITEKFDTTSEQISTSMLYNKQVRD